jgi:branched-chain amino acid transport system ATP-binding protein
MKTLGQTLSLEKVEKSFGDLHVIQDATLNVRAGERHAIIGPNGAGKSTLFNLISGRITLSSGHIRLGGKEISGQRPQTINRAGLSRSFQISNIFHRLTVFENVRIAMMRHYGVGLGLFQLASRMRPINTATEELIERVGLTSRAKDNADGLTYSEQRALEIALTLATAPSVILLDEPTAGMSRDETARAVELIKRTTVGLTLLIVEHDMTVVFGLSDRISVLAGGRVLATGSPQEIRSNAAVQTAYLGEAH